MTHKGLDHAEFLYMSRSNPLPSWSVLVLLMRRRTEVMLTAVVVVRETRVKPAKKVTT